MPDVKVREAILFLETPKTRANIREEFDLSNTQSWHLVRWLKKAKLILTEEKIVNGTVCEVHVASRQALKEAKEEA